MISDISAFPIVDADKKTDYGQAVVDHTIRYLSASSIASFDPSQVGGCHRRYWFEKIALKKPPETGSQKIGKDVHKEIENYLKTGQMSLGPVARAGLRFLPRPDSDLIVEQGFGNYKTALLNTGKESVNMFGLAFRNIPVMGAIDLRHRRGEWVDDGGVVRKEHNPNVAEIGDWKTTGSISSWAKSEQGLIDTVQMPLYAAAVVWDWPHLDFVRLSHGYFGTRVREAKKVSVLMSRATIDHRREQITKTVDEMIAVAKEETIDKVEPNLNACAAYRGCPHAPYCDRPAISITQVLQLKPYTGAMNMSSNGLFEAFVSTVNGMNIPSVPLLAPTVPQTEIERAAEIEAEKQRLLGNEAAAKLADNVKAIAGGSIVDNMGHCKDCRMVLSLDNISKLKDGTLKHIKCPGSVGAINPFDSPVLDLTKTAAPLKSEDIEMIEDTELKERATAHAAAVAAQTPPVLPKAGKSVSVSCANSGETVPLSRAEAANKKVTCADCGQTVKVKVADDFETGVVAKHKLAATAAEPETEHKLLTTPESPNAVYSMLPPPLPVVPPLPTAPTAPIERREFERVTVPAIPAIPQIAFGHTIIPAGTPDLDEEISLDPLRSIAESLRELVAILKAK